MLTGWGADLYIPIGFPPESEKNGKNPTDIEASHEFPRRREAEFEGSCRFWFFFIIFYSSHLEGCAPEQPDGKSIPLSDIPPGK
jgi:hypothetical protein